MGFENLSSLFQHRLSMLSGSADKGCLNRSLIGLEKETLRVNPEGSISQTAHPVSLGSALTNPYITTDYSEALLEFITPPLTGLNEALDFLRDTQNFVYSKLGGEILWATSMPCVVAGEYSIPIAQYGSSNAGMMKTIYRRGLGYRYGRVMQVIAGVHYNFSFAEEFWLLYQQLENDDQDLQEFISTNYFSMLRNLQRFGWLISYLFGASPAVCKSFLGDQQTTLSEFDAHTYYGPYATSLRMGDIGYQNNKENETGIKANYDSVDAYVQSLSGAITTVCPEYEKIGVKVDGEYRQLNSNILQIENEYYSTVRPKQIPDGDEKPSLALQRLGVRYVELRSLDVNAFDPLGINESQLYFLEAFMLYCLLQDSPLINAVERIAIDRNELDTAHRGREPQLRLQRNSSEVLLRDWALEICDDMQAVCVLLDDGIEGNPYSDALGNQREAVLNPDVTPSARMLAEMREHGEGFYHFAKRMSLAHNKSCSERQMAAERVDLFEQAAADSVARQQAMEKSDNCSLDEYLQRYFSQS